MATIEKRVWESNGKKEIRHKATVTVKGFPRTSKTFERRTDAVKWAEKTEYEYKNQRTFGEAHFADKLTSEAIERYTASLKLTNPARLREVGPIMAWWKQQIGHFKLNDVSKDQLYRYRDQLKAVHVKGNPKLGTLTNARVNRYMAALERLYNVAITEWEWLAKNPLAGIAKLPEPAGRTRFLSNEERDALFKAAEHSENLHLRVIIMLAITTGARRAEIENIQLKHIDLVQQKILVPITKTKRPRVLRLVEPALSHVQEMAKTGCPDDFLFSNPSTPHKPNGFRRAWNTALKRAKLKDFKFHDLRHTAASYLAQHGAGLHQISEILGHSSYHVTKRYVHLIEKDTMTIIEKTASKVFRNDGQCTVMGSSSELRLPEGKDGRELGEGLGVGVHQT